LPDLPGRCWFKAEIAGRSDVFPGPLAYLPDVATPAASHPLRQTTALAATKHSWKDQVEASLSEQ